MVVRLPEDYYRRTAEAVETVVQLNKEVVILQKEVGKLQKANDKLQKWVLGLTIIALVCAFVSATAEVLSLFK